MTTTKIEILQGRDILHGNQFNRDTLESLFVLADELKAQIQEGNGSTLLANQILATLFFEPSTRTRLSFETAMHRLGGKVIGFASDTSTSTSKGETFTDTIRTVDQYVDVIVVRHPEIGSANIAAEAAEVPVINAGDGAGQHPTQALLDLYTLKSEFGSLDGIKLALCGDLLNSRTVHSGVELFKLFDIELIFISPPSLRMPGKIITKLKSNHISVEETDSLEYGLQKADALYMTRIQKERFENANEYSKVKDSYVLSKQLVENNNPTIKILHPLPRVNELDRSLDVLPNARYFQQVKNGVYIRMALLAAILDH